MINFTRYEPRGIREDASRWALGCVAYREVFRLRKPVQGNSDSGNPFRRADLQRAAKPSIHSCALFASCINEAGSILLSNTQNRNVSASW